MAEPSGPCRAPQWRDALVSELRALSPGLDVPPAGKQDAIVRQRLEARQRPEPRPRSSARWRARMLYPRWRAALIVALTVLALAVAIPQSRAVIVHVLRLDGVELRQAPGPSPAPHPSLPGEQRMPLGQARQRVAFPVLVPAKLGRPATVTVSDSGRVATLIYDRTPYGQVRLDEFDGHLDQVYFEKFIQVGSATKVRLNGTNGLWVTGPQEVVYVRALVPSVNAVALNDAGEILLIRRSDNDNWASPAEQSILASRSRRPPSGRTATRWRPALRRGEGLVLGLGPLRAVGRVLDDPGPGGLEDPPVRGSCRTCWHGREGVWRVRAGWERCGSRGWHDAS